MKAKHLLKVNRIMGYDLDRAVAVALGFQFVVVQGRGACRFYGVQTPHGDLLVLNSDHFKKVAREADGHVLASYTKLWIPTLDWRQAGDIIDTFDIDVGRDGEQFRACLPEAKVHPNRAVKSYFTTTGPTKKVAAMRCFVTLKLGDVITLPEEPKL